MRRAVVEAVDGFKVKTPGGTGQRAVESGRSAGGRRTESVGSKAARVLHFWAVGRVDAIIPRKTNLQPSIPTYQDCSIKQIIPRAKRTVLGRAVALWW